jgi:glutamate racemase
MIAANDYLVLGCSHYIDSADKKILPEHIKIIDSGGCHKQNMMRLKWDFQQQKTNQFFYANTNRP